MRRGPDGVWRIRGYDEARTVLRSTGTVQAGLGIETVRKLPARVRRPVLYRDGPEHREHRRQTARFFTPRRVSQEYRPTMIRIAEAQLAKLRAAGKADLADLSFHLAIGVAASVIGLTEGGPGLRRRLERFIPERFGTPGFTSVEGIRWVVRQNSNWLRFYVADVRPAIRAHRRARRDDLISHLLDEGCTSPEILGECLSFAAAGMFTTREFVTVAAWHLFSDDALLRRYRAADEDERLAVLHELLRLEPVIGRLRRRTTAPLDVRSTDGTVTVPSGELVELLIDSANTDPRAVGQQPECLRPQRSIDGLAVASGLSFGDGPHRCPGAHIAILETDIFLSRLFAEPGIRLRSEPRLTFQEAIDSYALRGMTVAVGDG
ncbi:cytochrome P450 [Streptomyces daliensis]|uniref:Cytochrome P450 n=1 Tax=Streptomyces daliensis TaxID=299421 RepID=A0A8T4IR86_9ACTN|nr:cytochrome P450 [Streptomyces daliensis]